MLETRNFTFVLYFILVTIVRNVEAQDPVAILPQGRIVGVSSKFL